MNRDDLTRRARALGMREWPLGVDTPEARAAMLGWAEQNHLRYSDRGYCLHWLTRGRCSGGTGPCRQNKTLDGYAWLDRVTGWTRQGKPAVLVAQPNPYPGRAEDVKTVANNWRVTIICNDTGGWHGGTMFIAVWAPRES